MQRNCASEQENLDRKCNEHTLTQSLFLVSFFFLSYFSQIPDRVPTNLSIQNSSTGEVKRYKSAKISVELFIFHTHFQPWNKQITFPFFQRPSKGVRTLPEFQMSGIKKQQQQHLISSLQHEQCQACSLSFIDFAVSDTWDLENLFSCCCFITLNANKPELLCWPVPEDKRKNTQYNDSHVS